MARERRRRRADHRAVDADRALGLERARRRGGARARGGDGADAHGGRPAPAAVDGRASPGFAAAVARALRRRRRPLHHLERAEPAVVAAAAGEVLARPLHAGGAAPLPRARALGAAGDPGGRPGRAGADRGDVLARARPARAQRDAAPAGVPARARLRRRALAAAADGLLQGLQARHRRRLRVPPARHADLAGPRVSEPRRRQPRVAGAAASRRWIACSAAGGCARARGASASTSTSTATRPARPTGRPASRSPPRTAGCSSPPTARGATRA